LLVTTALQDARVGYWQSLKWVAKLRAVASEGSSIYLHTEMEAGHMGPSGRYEVWDKASFVLAFLLDQLGLSDADGYERAGATSPRLEPRGP
jgi:oligopeptidase B